MSVDTPLEVQVDLEDDGSARAVVTERRALEIDDLFHDGELRLWEDSAGWSGYTRNESADGDVVYHYVNTRHGEERWIDRMRVGEKAVREAVRQHIRDPLAGEAGVFRRRCSPP